MVDSLVGGGESLYAIPPPFKTETAQPMHPLDSDHVSLQLPHLVTKQNRPNAFDAHSIVAKRTLPSIRLKEYSIGPPPPSDMGALDAIESHVLEHTSYAQQPALQRIASESTIASSSEDRLGLGFGLGGGSRRAKRSLSMTTLTSQRQRRASRRGNNNNNDDDNGAALPTAAATAATTTTTTSGGRGEARSARNLRSQLHQTGHRVLGASSIPVSPVRTETGIVAWIPATKHRHAREGCAQNGIRLFPEPNSALLSKRMKLKRDKHLRSNLQRMQRDARAAALAPSEHTTINEVRQTTVGRAVCRFAPCCSVLPSITACVVWN